MSVCRASAPYPCETLSICYYLGEHDGEYGHDSRPYTTARHIPAGCYVTPDEAAAEYRRGYADGQAEADN